MDIKITQAKSILTKSKIPGISYAINPYVGCRFGCIYCYASFMARYTGRNTSDWGDFVDIKINAAELLEKEVKKLKQTDTVFFSSVTDPYQGLEAKYKITRQCLETLLESKYQGKISILTKSPIVLRDLDLFKKFNQVEVGLTITSTNDKVSQFFEKNAPPVSQRLEALKKLNAENIDTYAFVGPLLPSLVKTPEALDEIFKKIAETRTKEIYVEHLNLSTYIYERLKKEIGTDKESLELYNKTRLPEYRENLDALIYSLVEKYKLRLRNDETIYHRKK